MFRRLYDITPPAVKAHPLGLLAMFGWTGLGLSLLLPTFHGDPKPWNDLFWPATMSDAFDQRLGMVVLGVGMVASGVAFVAGQMTLPRLWAEKLRWGALWGALFMSVYVVVSILVKVFRDADEVAPYWPLSLVAWVTCSTLFLFSIPAAAVYGYGAMYRGPERRGSRDDD
jgi:hypothetical protein